MQDPLLDVRNLTVCFLTTSGPVAALNDVCLGLGKQEILGLVGETGCGKTLTALSILRLLPFSARIADGEIIFDKRNLLVIPENEMREIRGKRISMIFQDPTSSLDPVFRIGDVMREILQSRQETNVREATKQSIEMLTEVNLPNPERILGLYPHELSGGMKQRVMIAIALLSRPELLIADEPTTALDVTIQAQILELIRNLVKELGTSVLLVTHNFGIVAENCERVAVMYAGAVVEHGKSRNVLEKPAHPYTKGLLSAVPKLFQKKEMLEVIPGVIPSLIDPPPGCKFHPRCKYAADKCKREIPSPTEVDDGHYVSCFRIGQGRP